MYLDNYELYRMFVVYDVIDLCNDKNKDLTAYKNFCLIQQSISMRAVPHEETALCIVNSPRSYGAKKIKRQSYMWEFAIENIDAFYQDGNDVALLEKELNGVVLYSGDVLSTADNINIEFVKGKYSIDSQKIEFGI